MIAYNNERLWEVFFEHMSLSHGAMPTGMRFGAMPTWRIEGADPNPGRVLRFGCMLNLMVCYSSYTGCVYRLFVWAKEPRSYVFLEI